MSRLQLNEYQDYKAFPEEGTGIYIEQMPKLIAEGRTPLSASGLMKRRLEVRNASEQVRNSWFYNYFDLSDGNIIHPDGSVKIDLDSKLLRSLTPETKLFNHALPLQSEQYDSLQMPELSKKEVGQYMKRKLLKRKQVLDNKAWRILARHPSEVPKEYAEDEKLLPEYTDLIFSHGYDRAMAIFSAQPQDIPLLRSWCVGRLGDDDWSVAGGGERLDVDVRLVGVAPKAHAEK